jgi:hypothetical protein
MLKNGSDLERFADHCPATEAYQAASVVNDKR